MLTQPHYCGIDVAKDSFVATLKINATTIKDRAFKMDSSGFSQFAQFISPHPNILVGMEPTGIYHKNLLHFLNSLRYNPIVVNPYMLHQFSKFTNSKPTKTDTKDSHTITNFLEFQQNELQKSYQPIDERDSLKYFVREKEQITHTIAKTKTKIRTLLALLFPELERITGIFSKELLAILLHFGGAYKIKKTPREQFIKTAQELSPKNGRKPAISPEKLYELASSSIAYEWPDFQQLLKLLIKQLDTLLKQREEITKLIEEKADKFFKREIEFLCSIKGIGKECAIYFMAEIIDIKRFPNPRKLVGFCGLDPVIKQSGRFETHFRISKRGNAHARRIIWIMAASVKRNCPYFRDYYLKKRNEGKSYKEAVIATATKLLRTIYALLSQKRCFM